jgi:hypothetical protein
VSHTESHVIDFCRYAAVISVEPTLSRDGRRVFYICDGMDHITASPEPEQLLDFCKELLSLDTQIVCWDIRRVLDWPSSDKILWDVKSLWGGDRALKTLAQMCDTKVRLKIFRDLLDLDQRVEAHGRAAKTAGIPGPAALVAPPHLIAEWHQARARVIHALYHEARETAEWNYQDYEFRWPFIRALREVELNGIHVDLDRLAVHVAGAQNLADKRALNSIVQLERGGYVTTLLNPMGSKTGRVRPEGGFNSLAIPHGPARDCINSRFPGGLIYALDFNAIDYRCIVNAVGGEVAKLYAGAKDFHERTASFVFKNINEHLRESIKYLSYIYIYGGSEATLQEKTGWTLEQVKKVLELLDTKIAPIKEFREKLWMQAQAKGEVTVPGGRIIPCDETDSSGAVIGRFAQSYSTWVFEQAFVRVHRMLHEHESKIIFEVHDELVLDVHPDDFDFMDKIRLEMEKGGHSVKMMKGITYGTVE